MELPPVFFELHSGLKQQGPGSEASTVKALSLIEYLPEKLHILDVGCGPGRQTMTLAKHTRGHITAVDTYQPFLDQLLRRAEAEGVMEQISVSNQSMMDLDHSRDAFDLIWSEGAIYIMGFETGLKSWRSFLKPTGFMAVSEVAWLTETPDPQIKEFWEREYPAIKTIAEDLDIIDRAGYTTVGHFVLPEVDWWNEYYSPLETRLAVLMDKYAGDEEALAVLAASQEEIDLFRKYSQAYGYVFFVMRAR